MSSERVLIAGAGPVGLVAANYLAQRGIPVTVLEAEASLPETLRASTFHPPTLDMLRQFGVVDDLLRMGIKAPKLQYRDRAGCIAEFDFSQIADATMHPYRLQCEQFKLNILLHHNTPVPRCGSPAKYARSNSARKRSRR
jgi:3-(3-hydroxy-phenyl)propionate hydroxylase